MKKYLFPAYLWIGSDQDLLNKTELFLQDIFCKNNCCKECFICNQIKNKQHYLIRWIYPSNNYTLADIEIIFDTIKFNLNENEEFFFIIQRADLLSIATANRLLKSLEEPPKGYHFILLSPYLDGLLPTIVSRCLVMNYSKFEDSNFQNLSKFFKYPNNYSTLEFLKELEKTKITDKEIQGLIDDINLHWINIEKKEYFQNGKFTKTIQKTREKMAMPGSIKIFLKNLYLQLISIQ